MAGKPRSHGPRIASARRGVWTTGFLWAARWVFTSRRVEAARPLVRPSRNHELPVVFPGRPCWLSRSRRVRAPRRRRSTPAGLHVRPADWPGQRQRNAPGQQPSLSLGSFASPSISLSLSLELRRRRCSYVRVDGECSSEYGAFSFGRDEFPVNSGNLLRLTSGFLNLWEQSLVLRVTAERVVVTLVHAQLTTNGCGMLMRYGAGRA